MVVLDDLLATENSRSEKNVQVLALHAAAQRREIANVRDEKPARNVLDFPQRSLRQRRFVFVGNFLWLTKSENVIANCNLIVIAQP